MGLLVPVSAAELVDTLTILQIKAQINQLCGSQLVEEKSYAAY
jgi:hypothetical protein